MFDCFNVLVPCDTARFYSFIRNHQQNHLKPEELFSGSKKQLAIDYDLGKMTDIELFERVKEAFDLRGVLSEDFFKEWCAVAIPDHTMLGIRDEFRERGVGTILVSNMNRLHLKYFEENYPEVIFDYDYRMISCEEGVSKPNPEAWIGPLDYLGIRAEECLFIDDVYENIEVASSLGIKGWHYNIKDKNFITISPERLKEERKKLKNFLDFIWVRGIMTPKFP